MALTLDNFTQDQINELTHELTYNLESYQPPALPDPISPGINVFIDGDTDSVYTDDPHSVGLTLDIAGAGPTGVSIIAPDLSVTNILLSQLPYNNVINGLNVCVSKISDSQYLVQFIKYPTTVPRGYIVGQQVWAVELDDVASENITASLVALTRSLTPTTRAQIIP